MDGSGSCAPEQTILTTRGSGGDLPGTGQSCTRAAALREQKLVNPGEWPHMLSNRPHLRSHSGRKAGVAFAHAPTRAECTIPSHIFQVLLLERLQLPLPVTEAGATDATNRWTHSDDTEQHAHSLDESRSEQVRLNVSLHGCVAKRGPE